MLAPISTLPPLGTYFDETNGYDYDGYSLYKRHYTYDPHRMVAVEKFTPPGYNITLIGHDKLSVFNWQKTAIERYDGEIGYCCTLFRNESSVLSSALILEAINWAITRWGPGRLFTYVNPELIESANPVYCFKVCGFTKVRYSKKGLLLLACQLHDS